MGRNFLSFIGATPFYLAAKHGDVDLMQLLVEHGADPLTPTGQQVTPLMAAAGVGFWDGESPGPLNGTPEQTRLEAVRLAHALGNDIHGVTDFGNTALEGDGQALLLRHPLNLKQLDPQRDRGDMRWGGSTALHGAAMMGSNLIVEYLLEHARMDTVDGGRRGVCRKHRKGVARNCGLAQRARRRIKLIVPERSLVTLSRR